MLIISDDRFTIVDAGNGLSFTAEEPYPGLKNGYTIFVNFPTGGKRVLIDNINMGIAKSLMKRLFDELTQNSDGMMIQQPKSEREVSL